MTALLGIPDLGWIAWTILISVLVTDLAVLAVGIARITYQRQHREASYRSELPPDLRVIGGSRGPFIEHPTGKERL